MHDEPLIKCVACHLSNVRAKEEREKERKKSLTLAAKQKYIDSMFFHSTFWIWINWRILKSARDNAGCLDATTTNFSIHISLFIALFDIFVRIQFGWSEQNDNITIQQAMLNPLKLYRFSVCVCNYWQWLQIISYCIERLLINVRLEYKANWL